MTRRGSIAASWRGNGNLVRRIGPCASDGQASGPRARTTATKSGPRATRRSQRMAIAVGERVPDVKVFTFGEKGPEATSTEEVLGKGRVVLFGVPGAFTPTCSDHHLPGFVLRAADLRAKGADRIVCVSVNDPFVM